MAFNSLSYFLFLPLAYLAFSFAPDRFRWLVLLAASYGFYAALGAPELLLALTLSAGVSYACGIGLAGTADERKRRLIFWSGTAACALVLALMKYAAPLAAFFGAAGPYPGLLVSIGVSYFTLQAVSGMADVYLGAAEAERHFGRHVLSLVFFPKLLQGPIERAGGLLPQLKKKFVFDYGAARSGLILFTWGLFKKVVVADRLALYVNPVYGDVHSYTGLSLLVATYAYALQIYFDFAGYTDMARGSARLFGIDLTENFDRPYLSVSVADFWRRWHISFSRWILDYIFRPLQMAWRGLGRAATALALLATFLFSGVWHGTGPGFVVWGLLHGSYLAVSVFYRPHQKALHERLGLEGTVWLKCWRIFVTFNLVSFAWIFFRAQSVSDAVYVVKNILDFGGSYEQARALGAFGFFKTCVLMGTERRELVFAAVSLAAVSAAGKTWIESLRYRPFWVKLAVYNLLVIAILAIGITKENFIYFRF